MQLIGLFFLFLYYRRNHLHSKVHEHIFLILIIQRLVFTPDFGHNDILDIIKPLNYLSDFLRPFNDQNGPFIGIFWD